MKLLEILVGVITTEWTFIFAARHLFGKYINDWYTNFSGWAVLSDISSIMIGIFIAMYFYTGKNLLVLIGVAVLVQWIHDLLFYTLVIQRIPEKTNGIIDMLKIYGKDAGFAAVIGDSWMMVGSLLGASLASKLPVNAQIFTLLVGGYMLPYAIYQHPINK
jgi:hypothetical protein